MQVGTVETKASVTTADPSVLASPCKSKPPRSQPGAPGARFDAVAVDSRSRSAMSSPTPDGARGAGTATGPEQTPGPAGDSSSSAASPASGAADSAGSSVQDGDDEAWRQRDHVCSAPGHSHDSGPSSVEDKCLECCVYYGVMCCQCTILWPGTNK